MGIWDYSACIFWLSANLMKLSSYCWFFIFGLKLKMIILYYLLYYVCFFVYVGSNIEQIEYVLYEVNEISDVSSNVIR